ncbi:FAD-binding oxidoreductase [Phenylobacterium sp.]|uniref:NAD(P)/FAD-dependent oxidoreductase n=1 Tax=Phenylobacterium sp. TaxID=1871053 RepID=UPI00272F923C|nr:FAD-dependent oxidoreductase [Phenylobacterium sp.]MDP1616730.1 FAD-dependent oxidoreductase [Phenylobacterium sp.]MDP1985880.1 FAD-dependent oxidoreductase [Phenylobacterium sp.]
MTKGLRVAVAGAGVFGLASALALARAGAQVSLHDPAAVGVNASGVAAGMLAPVSEALTDPVARPHLDLMMVARDLWPRFAERWGLDLDRRGAILLGDHTRLAGLSQTAKALGLDLPPMPTDRLPAFPGGYGAVIEGGLQVAGDWRIDAASLGALTEAAQGLGVRLSPQPPADPVDWLVVATGPSQDLIDRAPELSTLSPIKGHILRFDDLAYDGPVLRGPGAYAAPGAGGLRVGATMETGVSDPTVDAAVAGNLAQAAGAVFPGLTQRPWTAHAGVRAATPDGLPLVGPSRTPGVILAAGARRNGWLLAPLVGALVCAYARGEDPGVWAGRLAADRFSG